MRNSLPIKKIMQSGPPIHKKLMLNRLHVTNENKMVHAYVRNECEMVFL